MSSEGPFCDFCDALLDFWTRFFLALKKVFKVAKQCMGESDYSIRLRSGCLDTYLDNLLLFLDANRSTEISG